ncbi:MAG: hypothetical protein ACOCTK_02100, partial [Candidatus Saliniplasma sp.]
MSMEEGKKEEGETEARDGREMTFKDVFDFFVENKHLPEPEEYDAIGLYEGFQEYWEHDIENSQDLP